jgi:hypothetical protein
LEKGMRDKKLVAIVVGVLVLVTLHLVDHVFRGELPLPLSSDSLPFIVASLVIYGVLAAGLLLYAKNSVGPRFWTVIFLLGLGLGWLSHCSPYTDLPVQVIQGTYQSAFAGWLAVTCLLALMSVLGIGAVYAGYAWMRDTRRQR